jgi:hypothetical protein
MSDLNLAITLLKMAKCPNCDGSGGIVTIGYGTVAGCCGNVLDTGEWCGNAIPIEVQVPDYEQCQWCAETKELIDKYEKELEM